MTLDTKTTGHDSLWEGRFLEMQKINGWEFVQRKNPGGVVAIIAITAQNELLVTEQFRPPVGKMVLDLAAGLVGDEEEFSNEDACQAARKELIEECGYVARHYSRLFDRPTSPGLSNEVVTFVHAENLKKVSAGGGVGNENIKVHRVPVSEVGSWMKEREKEGYLIDPKIDVALAYIARRILSEKQEIHLNAPLVSRDKIMGMVLGAVFGDTLGAAVECLSKDEIKENYGRITGFVKPIKQDHHGIAEGEYSDDSQFILGTLEAIIEAHGFDMQKIADAHIKAKSESTAGWGASTKEAIERLESGVPWQHSGESIIENRGVGNGVAMKMPALAALLSESTVDEETFLKIITAFSRMTHANNLAVASGMVQCKALIYCLNHSSDDFSSDEFRELLLQAAESSKDALPLSRSAGPLIDRLSLLENAEKMTDDEIVSACDGGDSYIPNSLPQTLLFFLRNYQNILPVFDAVNAGGDTDTNASMAGALLGALHGESIFPQELLAKVKKIEVIKEAVSRFCDKFLID